MYKLSNLGIYKESWEETMFNLVDLQDDYQFCKIKPVLSNNDIKQYILFYDKFLSSMIVNKTIPFPNVIHSKIYKHVIIDFFILNGRKKERTNLQVKKHLFIYGVFYIILFPFCFFFIFWNIMKYFELFYGSTKYYQWSDYAIYKYREKNEYKHQVINRLKSLNNHAYNIVHFNDNPILYTFVKILSFVSGNILFYYTIMIFFDNETILIRWVGLLTLIIGICQKWLISRIDNIENDKLILSTSLDDNNITKKKLSHMYINNFNMVSNEIISIFQYIWFFIFIYPKYIQKLQNFFKNTEFIFPIGDIKN